MQQPDGGANEKSGVPAGLTGAWVQDPMSILGSQAALLAAAKTGMLDLLSRQPATAAECAAALQLNARAVECVLEVLVVNGLATREGQRYQVKIPMQSGGAFSGEVIALLQRHFAHTELLLRTGEPIPFMDDSPQQREASYKTLVADMAKLSATAAAQLQDRLKLDPSHILDVGCGSGVWSLHLAARAPRARVTGLDFAKVLDVFVAQARSMGLADRIELLPGDMHHVEFPEKFFDVALIANVLRLESADNARQLVARVASSVRPGGCLVVVDALAGGTVEKDRNRAVYALHLAVRTSVGGVHSVETIREWMQDAGLANNIELDLGAGPGALGALMGRRPLPGDG